MQLKKHHHKTAQRLGQRVRRPGIRSAVPPDTAAAVSLPRTEAPPLRRFECLGATHRARGGSDTPRAGAGHSGLSRGGTASEKVPPSEHPRFGMGVRLAAWAILALFIVMTGDSYAAPHRVQLVNLTATPALVQIRAQSPSYAGTYIENYVYVMGNQTSFHEFDPGYITQYEVYINDGWAMLSWTDVVEDRLHLVYWNDSNVYNRLGVTAETRHAPYYRFETMMTLFAGGMGLLVIPLIVYALRRALGIGTNIGGPLL